MKVLVIFLIIVVIIGLVTFHPVFAEDIDWLSIPVIGEYRNWELPKEADVFNLQYRIINGTITYIESVPTLTVFDIASNNSGQIQLKIPKNYPFTNYPQDGRERDALYVNIDETRINTESVVIKYDDCFYNYSIPFKKDDSTIEVGFSKTLGFNPYVIEEVPNYCIENVFAKPPFPKHIAIEFSPLSQTQLGISSHEIQCKQNLLLIQKYDGTPACVTESTKLKLIERGWTTKDSSAQKIIDEITTPKYGTTEFDTEYHKTRQIYLDVRKPMDLPFIGLTIDSTEKYVVLGINSDKLTAEKDKTYYRQLVDELFKDVNLNIMIHYKNTTGLIFDE